MSTLAHSELSWQQAHAKLVEHAKHRAELDYTEGELLLDARLAAAHVHLGFATFEQYVEFLLGYSPRMTAERLRVAESLRDLPESTRALREGELNWSAVRELTRVAVSDTESAWIQAANGKTARQVEELVSGHVRGDLPEDPARDDARPRVLRFEVSAETYALFREAEAHVRRQAGGLDDDQVVQEMARRILKGPADERRASYQVALTVCPECRRGAIVSRGEAVAVGPEVVEKALCDAQQVDIDDTHVGTPRKRATQTIPPSVRREVMRRDKGQCRVPGCRCADYVDIHHIRPRAEGGNHEPNGLVVLCGAHHRAVHDGRLLLQGDAGQLDVRHADGTPFGRPVRAELATACVDAQAALRGMGFKESEARSAVATARLSGAESTTELVRTALRSLKPRLRAGERRARYLVVDSA